MYYIYQKNHGDLQQGDILKKTDYIQKILAEYHPYYSNHPDYSHLMVLTQSCDLKKRKDGSCKSKYITLAAVRSFETAISREISKYQRGSLEQEGNICCVRDMRWFEDFIVKLLNNNIPEYFFLAEDQEAELLEPRVAFLNLSVPIKANEHYDECLRARILQLDEIFQAKLGWLVGNMYSKVGSPDWVPAQGTEIEFKSNVKRIVEQACLWFPEKLINSLKKRLRIEREKNATYFFKKEEIQQYASDYAEQKESRKEKTVELLLSELSVTLKDIKEIELALIKTKLLNNKKFAEIFR